VEADVAALSRRIMLMEEEAKKSEQTLADTVTKLAVSSKVRTLLANKKRKRSFRCAIFFFSEKSQKIRPKFSERICFLVKNVLFHWQGWLTVPTIAFVQDSKDKQSQLF
jgi:hypothetical protein